MQGTAGDGHGVATDAHRQFVAVSGPFDVDQTIASHLDALLRKVATLESRCVPVPCQECRDTPVSRPADGVLGNAFAWRERAQAQAYRCVGLVFGKDGHADGTRCAATFGDARQVGTQRREGGDAAERMREMLEQSKQSQTVIAQSTKELYDLFRKSPLVDLEIAFERDKSLPPSVDLF